MTFSHFYRNPFHSENRKCPSICRDPHYHHITDKANAKIVCRARRIYVVRNKVFPLICCTYRSVQSNKGGGGVSETNPSTFTYNNALLYFVRSGRIERDGSANERCSDKTDQTSRPLVCIRITAVCSAQNFGEKRLRFYLYANLNVPGNWHFLIFSGYYIIH